MVLNYRRAPYRLYPSFGLEEPTSITRCKHNGVCRNAGTLSNGQAAKPLTRLGKPGPARIIQKKPIAINAIIRAARYHASSIPSPLECASKVWLSHEGSVSLGRGEGKRKGKACAAHSRFLID